MTTGEMKQLNPSPDAFYKKTSLGLGAGIAIGFALGALLTYVLAMWGALPFPGSSSAGVSPSTSEGSTVGKAQSAVEDPRVARERNAQKMAQALIGRWAIDMDSLKEMDEFKNMPEDQKEAAMKMMEGMAASMSIEIGKDKMTMEMMGKKEEATYSIKKTEGNKLTVETKTKKEGGAEKTEEVVLEVNGDKIMFAAEGQKFALKRK